MKMNVFKIYTKTFLLALAISLPLGCSDDDGPKEDPFVDTEAIYTVSDPKEVGDYVTGESLATVADTDGGITNATLETGSDLPAGTALNAVTGEITVSDPTLLVQGSYQLSITTEDSQGGTTLHSVAITFNEDFLPLNINSGGEEIVYTDVTFKADQYFIGNSTTFATTSSPEIANTEMDALFYTERFSTVAEGFGYEVELPNGNYTVILHFAEIFWGAPDGNPTGGVGSRIFDVTIEGGAVLENFDIFSEVGALAAVAKEFSVTLDDGMMNIDFTASVDNPKISAIQIIEMP